MLTKVDTTNVVCAEPPAWAIGCLEKMCKATGFKGQVGLTVHTGEFPTRVGVTDKPHAYARQGDDYTLIVLPEWAEDNYKWHSAIAHEFVHALHADIDRFVRSRLPEDQHVEYWQAVETSLKPFAVLLMVGMLVGAVWVEDEVA